MTQPTFHYADDIDEHSRALTEQLLAEWQLVEPADRLQVTKLAGGASNINLRISGDRGEWALRLCDPLAARWGVSREASIQAQRDAAAIGLAPRVIAERMPEGHFLSEFVLGATVTSDLVREAELLAPVAHTLRTLNAGSTSGRDFSPFDDLGIFLEYGDGDGIDVAETLTFEIAAAKRIQSLFETRPAPRGFCHSDLVPQNFLLHSDHLTLVDFDYAGRGWVAFELASFACQAQLTVDESQEFLLAYDPDADEGQIARVELMRALAGIREALWSYMAEPFLSGTTKPLDGWTYRGYAADNLKQAHSVLDDGGLERNLRAARQVRPGALF